MKVQKQAGILTALLVLFLFTSVAGVAKDSRKLTLGHAATVNGTQLAPGNYQVSWVTHSPEAKVTFTQHKKVAATAEGKWVERQNIYDNDGVVYDNNPDGSRTIVEIRFAGMNQVLTFGQPSPASQTTSVEPLMAAGTNARSVGSPAL
jgi:hypothetical protein